MQEHKLRRIKRGARTLVGMAVLSLIAFVVATVWTMVAPISSNVTSPPALPEISRSPQIVSASSDVLFTGNIFWGRRINDWSMASPLKYAYPFSRLHELDRDRYNAWVGGLECPVVPGVTPTAYEEDVILKFNCSPDYLKEASKWFNILTLANNHTDNQGTSGFKATQQQLDKNGIQYFGHYDPRVLEDVCEVIGLPVTVNYDNQSTTSGKLPVAMCGYHGVFRLPSAEAAAVIGQYSDLMPVFALPHMGQEYQPAPDQLKTSFYRSLIDAGADAVIGDHPHWVQTSESYKGHLIVYSMGNFLFDQQDTAEVTRSAAIEVKLKTSDSAKLEAWLKLGESCTVYKDDCLDQIKQTGLAKLDMTFKFGVVATDSTNKITRLASPQKRTDILRRLNWDSTMGKLKAPYSKI